VRTTSSEDRLIPRKSYLQRLHPYSGTYSDKPLWRLALDPITVCYNPAVIWAICLMSFPTLWIVAINLLIAQIFASPPFLLTTTQLGYMNGGPAIGGTLGSLAAGALSDPVIKLMSRRNKGIYEPEYRLLMIVPAIILSTISYFLFGSLIEQGKSPVAMATLWGTATASLQFMMMAVGTYCVDAYRSSSVEIFIATMVVKNFLFFGFSCELLCIPALDYVEIADILRLLERLGCKMGASEDVLHHRGYPDRSVPDYGPLVDLWQAAPRLVAQEALEGVLNLWLDVN
jgi:hypothetical protein